MAPPSGCIIVVNQNPKPITVFVSKYSDTSASDDWQTIAPGQRMSFNRRWWELVAIKLDKDHERAGAYVTVNHTVVFRDLNNISVV